MARRWGWALIGLSIACSAPRDVEPIAQVSSAVAQGPWSILPSSPPQLTGHTATLIGEGRVLVIGGVNAIDAAQDRGYLLVHTPGKRVVETKLAGKLVEARQGHTATTMASGKILVAGGEAGIEVRSTAELVDTTTTLTTLAAPMRGRRTKHAAAALPDGKVLVVGGRAALAELSSAEIYDPGTNTWSDAPPMSTPRVFPTATTLNDGTILVVGGTTRNADLFDPKTKTFTRVGNMTDARVGHVASKLPSGKVLVAGGYTELLGPSSAAVTPTAEIYDPATKAWTKVPPMPTPRGNATATLLPNGAVLVAGGRVELTPLNYVDVYDEKTNAWQSGSPMVLPHALHTATAFSNGDVLVVGSAFSELFTLLPQATECSRAADCETGFCVDGVCCATSCTGGCERCDTSGASGACTAVSGAFNHCAPGNTCIKNACVPSAGTTCSADRLSVVSKDGAPTSCAPYVCDNSVGVCAKECASSVDCAPGSLCSAGTKQCVPAAPAADDEGGCAASPRPSRPWGAAFAAVAALAGVVVARRRRAARTR
ncbi:MAG: hypothetical protein HYV09_25970 [Deltaproteobacteria bacterium]|nr:hypothetical protein [Deltaproteobacteria bacterium]